VSGLLVSDPESGGSAAVQGPRLAFGSRLTPGCGADVLAQPVQMRAGVFKIPGSQRRLMRRHEHRDKDKGSDESQDENQQPHRYSCSS
jgi:hypothetical protein